METRNHLQPGEGWPQGAEGARLQSLLELVRSTHAMDLSEERREWIRARVLERLERTESRRRTARALIAGGSAVLLTGLLLALVRRAFVQRS